MIHQLKKTVVFRGWTFEFYELVDMVKEQVLLDLQVLKEKNENYQYKG